MLGIAWSELGLIMLIAAMLLKPRQIMDIFKFSHKIRDILYDMITIVANYLKTLTLSQAPSSQQQNHTDENSTKNRQATKKFDKLTLDKYTAKYTKKILKKYYQPWN